MGSQTNNRITWEALPAELLSKIFLDTLPVFEGMIPDDCDTISDKDGEYPLQLEGHEYMSPVVLAAVSRYWRDVATKTVRLWSFVYVCIDDQNTGMDAETILLWLERSQGTLLTAVCMSWAPALSKLDFRIISAMFAAQDRFERLYVDLNFVEYIRQEQRVKIQNRPLDGAPFPHLRVASIYIKATSERADPSISKNLLQPAVRGAFQNVLSAPSLKRVKIQLHEDMESQMTVVPWPTQIMSPLTSLHIAHPDVAALLTFAGCCPQLEDLGVHYPDSAHLHSLTPPFNLTAPVHLPQVHSLTWKITLEREDTLDEIFAPIVFKYVTTPKLKKLDVLLYNCCIPAELLSEPFADMITRSQCDLEAVTIIYDLTREHIVTAAETIDSFLLPTRTQPALPCWNTITTADLCSVPTTVGVAFLQACTNLERLKMFISTDPKAVKETPPAVTSRLRSLEISLVRLGSRNETSGTIFEYLNAPCLQHLCLRMYRSKFLPRILAFLARSDCKLASLKAERDFSEEGEDPEILDFLRSPILSTLSTLKLNRIRNKCAHNFIGFLTSSQEDGQPILPALKTLALVYIDKTTPGKLADAFRYRFEKAGLRCGMVIRWAGKEVVNFHRQDLEAMQKLQEKGYDMKFWVQNFGTVPRRATPRWVRRVEPQGESEDELS